MGLCQELDQGQLIVLPVFLQLVGRWIFTAGQLQRDLMATVPDVVKVLHSSGQRIPMSAVGDAIFESRGATFTRLGRRNGEQVMV